MSREPAWPLLGAAAIVILAWLGADAVCAVLFGLITVLPEHSQTAWGIRSAADLATFYNTRPVAALPVSIFDVVFVAACLCWVAAPGRVPIAWQRFRPRDSRLATSFALAAAFLGIAAIVGFWRIRSGFEPYHVLRELRPPLYFLALLVIATTQLADRQSAKRFAALAAAVVALHGVEGYVRFLFGIGRWKYERLMIYFDFADSLAIAFGLCIVGAAWALRTAATRRYAMTLTIGASFMGFAFIFSFRRSFWLGLTVGSLLLLWLLAPRQRLRLVTLGTASLLLVGFLFVGARFAQSLVSAERAQSSDEQVRFVGERIASMTDANYEAANRFRVFDALNAAGAVLDTFGLGMGLGSRYRVVWYDAEQREFLEHVNRTSHNTYLYLAMKMGVVGLIAWAWLYAELLATALRGRRRALPHISLAVAATLVTTAIAALFMPVAYNLRPMVMLALVGGLGLAAARSDEPEG
jgi:uncharacterized membrane protein YqjE